MPKPLQYKANSLIYANGEEADKVFILQNGKVSVVSEDIETGDNVREQVQSGEFFGVKSALGRYPREGNAISLANSTVIALTIPEFETMVMANPPILVKMLKVFSKQLRRLHTQVSRLLETQEVRPDEGLFAIGEKYMKSKRYSHAEYVFSRYLLHYPGGERTEQATKYLQAANAALSGGAKADASPPDEPEAAPPDEADADTEAEVEEGDE